MKPFSWRAWAGMVTFVLVSAGVSWCEGTFTSKSVTMGFVNHGGMWGDLVILPIVAGQIIPYVWRDRRLSRPVLAALLVLAAMITIGAHQQWQRMGEAMGTTDHVFPSHGATTWYRDMSLAGYLHVVYMSGVLALLIAYAAVPIPPSTTVLVSVFLTVHLIVGQLQPAWYLSGTIWEPSTIMATTIPVLAVWVVGAWKSRRRGPGRPTRSIAVTIGL